MLLSFLFHFSILFEIISKVARLWLVNQYKYFYEGLYHLFYSYVLYFQVIKVELPDPDEQKKVEDMTPDEIRAKVSRILSSFLLA